MFRVSGATTIDRSANEVAAFLADPANDSQWQKGVVHLAPLSGSPGKVGATYERVQLVRGKNVKSTVELTAFEPGQQVTFSGKGKILEYKLEYVLEPNGKTTRLRMQFEGEMLGFAALFESMAAEELEKEIPASLERLGKLFEK